MKRAALRAALDRYCAAVTAAGSADYRAGHAAADRYGYGNRNEHRAPDPEVAAAQAAQNAAHRHAENRLAELRDLIDTPRGAR